MICSDRPLSCGHVTRNTPLNGGEVALIVNRAGVARCCCRSEQWRSTRSVSMVIRSCFTGGSSPENAASFLWQLLVCRSVFWRHCNRIYGSTSSTKSSRSGGYHSSSIHVSQQFNLGHHIIVANPATAGNASGSRFLIMLWLSVGKICRQAGLHQSRRTTKEADRTVIAECPGRPRRHRLRGRGGSVGRGF